MEFLSSIGRAVFAFLASVGRLSLFAAMAVSHCVRPPFHFRALGRQLIDIGFYSLPVVGMTTLFTGMVLTLQSASGFEDFESETAIATIVVIAVTRELAPVLAGLMVAGRIGASMAAEIGTMRVTEQIDALSTLSASPMKYLVVPRLLAGTLMLPVLVMVGNVIGVFGGYLVGVYQLGFNPNSFLGAMIDSVDAFGVTIGLVKAAVFGFLIALMGCYHGYNSAGGAQGVGAATTHSVVSASILILLTNYVITEAFL